ncbi:protein translocase subunit SecF [Nevskia soli]|jgi:preprotein translocase subunit SecF|uniref:protein translocase subunit SecF n=1 Tax=Nevskia soli TaxID=418856 RepID=UPI0015D91A81|nr:protein translocase subunit SecF [Nevskia soli]
MELFRATNFDFLGRKWPFIIASLVLTAAGLGSLLVKGGPRYGIDFKGGTMTTVKFAQSPPMNRIRSVIDQKLGSGASVQSFVGGTNEVSIGTEGADSNTRARVMSALEGAFGQPANGKLDLNNASSSDIANRLRAPLQSANVFLGEDQLTKLANDIRQFRDAPPRSGLITDYNQLSSVPGMTPQILNVIRDQFSLSPFTLRSSDFVGPKVGADLRRQAVVATLCALGGMLIYIAFRFEWIYGLGAVIAVFHDTIITIGVFSLLNKEIDLTVIAALLTLVGYSMNDTIVIFDRIRENLRLGSGRRESLEGVINRSVNQTLSRTVMTSGLTFLTVLALFLFGGPVLHGFSLALVIGIIVGTYSSVFVASPIVLAWQNWADKRRKNSPGSPVAVRNRPVAGARGAR